MDYLRMRMCFLVFIGLLQPYLVTQRDEYRCLNTDNYYSFGFVGKLIVKLPQTPVLIIVAPQPRTLDPKPKL